MTHTDDMRKRHHYVPPRASRPGAPRERGGWVIDRPLRTPADIELEVATLEMEERLRTGPGLLREMWRWIMRG